MSTIPVLQGLASEDTLASVLATVFRRYGTVATRIPYADRLTSSHSIIPTTGKRIRLIWVQVLPATITNPTGNKVIIKFRTTSNIYSGEVVGHWDTFEGAVDEPLDITLANAEPVDVNVHYEEF